VRPDQGSLAFLHQVSSLDISTYHVTERIADNVVLEPGLDPDNQARRDIASGRREFCRHTG
jgi:hypothetical protein